MAKEIFYLLKNKTLERHNVEKGAFRLITDVERTQCAVQVPTQWGTVIREIW